MNWKKNCLKNFKLYAITDIECEDARILKKIEQAFLGGVDIIQLRSKTLLAASLIRLGQKIKQIANRHRKLFIINDRPDIMLALDADGVHLGQNDLPIQVARQMIRNPSKIIGKSTHSFRQAVQAEQEGADYIGFGPIFKTPTKAAYAPVGLRNMKRVHECVSIPIVCIGGINEFNLDKVINAGAKRIAVVRAIFSVPQPKQAAHSLKRIIQTKF